MAPPMSEETSSIISARRYGGKTTKRSRFGPKLEHQKRSTLATTIACEKAGLHYHVLDSERAEHYLQTSEIEDLVLKTNRLETILTISSRHTCSLEYLRAIAPLLNKTRRIGLNLVVGNPTYLSDAEARSSARDTLASLVALARRILPEKEIFIGTEGLLDFSLSLAKRYDLNPFLLLDRDLEEHLQRVFRETPEAKTAIYTPYLISEADEELSNEILKLLGPYVIRRKWVQKRLEKIGYELTNESTTRLVEYSEGTPTEPQQSELRRILLDSASELAICGDRLEVSEGIRSLFEKGIDLVVGLPAKDCEEQVIALGQCVATASTR